MPAPLTAKFAVGFDIETTGKELTDIVTVACAWSPTSSAYCFNAEDPTPVIELLNSATHIYTFNGMEFDLPRFAKHCGCSMEAWAMKTVDPLFAMKHVLGFGACVRLNNLLLENGYSPKSGSGLEAIEMWHNGNHQELMSYCMDDARLTYELCASPNGIKWAEKWVLNLNNPRILEFQPQPTLTNTSGAANASADAHCAPPPALSD
jgi:hypothetical protein